MIKKFTLFIVVPLVILLAGGDAVLSRTKSARDEMYEQIELLSDVITVIQRDYVTEVSAKDIIYGALKGMLTSLDTYSQFMDPDTYKDLQVETEGQFGGLGIEITIKDNLLTIITPLDETPAYKAGLKAQDRIVRIDGKITRDITLTEAVKKMRGKPGTEVTLTIMREDEDELKDYTIIRDIISIESVRRAELADETTGYIRLVDFTEKTKKDLRGAIKKLRDKGMDALILDLRNNPGGLLVAAVETASEFLAGGDLIVSTQGREKRQNVEYRATGRSEVKKIPLILLINGGSASASEIVAGAIQDHRRGVILGTASFGKGSVQTVIPMRDGSALRLTTAKYYTPSGRLIDSKGITPDVIVEQEIITAQTKEPEKSNGDVFEKIENNGKDSPDEETDEKTKQFREFIRQDYQLRAAINLMRGIKVLQGKTTAKEIDAK